MLDTHLENSLCHVCEQDHFGKSAEGGGAICLDANIAGECHLCQGHSYATVADVMAG